MTEIEARYEKAYKHYEDMSHLQHNANGAGAQVYNRCVERCNDATAKVNELNYESRKQAAAVKEIESRKTYLELLLKLQE